MRMMNSTLPGLVMCTRMVVGDSEVLSRHWFCHTYPELGPLGAVLSEDTCPTLKAVGLGLPQAKQQCYLFSKLLNITIYIY